jgi:hypothetical protein
MLRVKLGCTEVTPGHRIGRVVTVALAWVFVASPAGAQHGGSGAGARLDSALVTEGEWLAANLPKLASVRMIQQTGVMQARIWVSRAALDRCMLTLERVTEAMDASRSRRRDMVPLDRVDAQSIDVRQQSLDPEPGVASQRPWRVVLALLDGSIRVDIDGISSGGRTSRNSTTLELLVASREAGLEVASHLQSVVHACQ